MLITLRYTHVILFFYSYIYVVDHNQSPDSQQCIHSCFVYMVDIEDIVVVVDMVDIVVDMVVDMDDMVDIENMDDMVDMVDIEDIEDSVISLFFSRPNHHIFEVSVPITF